MSSRDIECIVRGARLGECPLWSVAERVLYWVDIDGLAIHRYDPATGVDDTREMPGRPGSLALLPEPGRLLAAIETGLAFVDWASGSYDPWIDLEPAGTGNRLNDGRCDRTGRFWVGSMYHPSSAGRASGLLHRVDASGESETVRSGIGVANGLAFSPDGRTMYFADTHRATVWAYDYDGDSGEMAGERVFLDFERSDLPGRPDGGCVDADGYYWIACVYGWAVLRATPDGEVVERIDMPVEKPTMPAFGGPSMTTLFVTSIGDGGSRPLAPGQPDAGGLFAIETDIRGIPETPFAGRTSGDAP